MLIFTCIYFMVQLSQKPRTAPLSFTITQFLKVAQTSRIEPVLFIATYMVKANQVKIFLGKDLILMKSFRIVTGLNYHKYCL